jgi:hypothetical protein
VGGAPARKLRLSNNPLTAGSSPLLRGSSTPPLSEVHVYFVSHLCRSLSNSLTRSSSPGFPSSRPQSLPRLPTHESRFSSNRLPATPHLSSSPWYCCLVEASAHETLYAPGLSSAPVCLFGHKTLHPSFLASMVRTMTTLKPQLVRAGKRKDEGRSCRKAHSTYFAQTLSTCKITMRPRPKTTRDSLRIQPHMAMVQQRLTRRRL